jgi:hypothetical protein
MSIESWTPEHIAAANRRITEITIDCKRAEREERVQDPDADPIRYCLTLLRWFERWEWIRLRRYRQGRDFPVQRDEKGRFQFYGQAGKRYVNQTFKLSAMRQLLVVAGCRLGASPIEMGQLFKRICEALHMLSNWDKEIPPSAEEAEERFHDILEREYLPRIEPINDLLAWRKAREGKHDQPIPAIATQETTEGKALSLLFSHPTWGAKEVARAVGCSREYLYRLPRVRAALAVRQSGRNERQKGFRGKNGLVDGFSG